jgi:hypothetical protein
MVDGKGVVVVDNGGRTRRSDGGSFNLEGELSCHKIIIIDDDDEDEDDGDGENDNNNSHIETCTSTRPMSNPALTSRLAARIKSGSCPIHGHGRYHPHPRRLASTVSSTPPILTPASVKALVPTMEDLVLWKWDKVTVAMSGGVDSAVVLRMLAEYVGCRRDLQWGSIALTVQPLDINVVFMRNWDSLLSENNDNDDLPSPASYHYSSDPSSSKSPNMSPCGWQKDWDMVQRVCDHVGVPKDRVRLVDLSKEYWAKVFEPALNVWEHGGTPNPDVACNREIKFGALFEHIPNKDRSFLATGE